MGVLQNVIYRLTIKPRLKKLQRILPEAKIYPAGSRYVCNPPTLFTDIDFVVYSEAGIDGLLLYHKYKLSPWEDYRQVVGTNSDEFAAWRKGRVNLIVTTSWKYADRFNTATHVCRRLNLRKKWQRIVVHEAFRGNWHKHPDLRNPDLFAFLDSLNGPNGPTVYQAYKARHDLMEL